MMRSVRIAAGALGAALGAVVAGLATEALAQEAAQQAAQQAPEEPASIDAAIAGVLGPISEFLASMVFYEIDVAGTSVGWIVAWLGLALILITLYLGFINLTASATCNPLAMSAYG